MPGYSGCGTNKIGESMYNYDLLKGLCVDEESKVIFDARKNYLNDRTFVGFYNIIRKNKKKYVIRDLESYMELYPAKGWGSYGAGDVAEYNRRLIEDVGFPAVVCNEADGCEKAYKLVNEQGYAILFSVPYGQDNLFFKNEICKYKENAVLVVNDHLVGRCGIQYFDFFRASENEVFIDGGCLDGTTSAEFVRWCGGSYDAILAFEPNPLLVKQCEQTIQSMKISNIHFYDKALWNCNEICPFCAEEGSKWDARISIGGQFMVPGITLDYVCGDYKVTFIKLDIEGAEKECLQGAKKTIEKNRPKMAVSVYHAPEDLFWIMEYILHICNEYKFALRHYHSDCIETVLYAFIGDAI